MTQLGKNRRTRLVVNRPLQRRIVFGISMVPILTLVGATLAVAVLTGQVLDEARSAEENLPTLGPLFVSLFLFIVAAGAVVVIQALKYSHRIAGPMYRLIKSMERIRQRDLSFRVSLRSGDELTELADELNDVMDFLREQKLVDGRWITDPEEAKRLFGQDAKAGRATDEASTAKPVTEEPQPIVEPAASVAATAATADSNVSQ